MAENVFDTNLRLNGPNGPVILVGTGSPEGVVSAPVSSEYFRLDTAPFRYIKETGTGNTGWVAVASSTPPLAFKGAKRFSYFNDFMSLNTDELCSNQVTGTGAANSTQGWQFGGVPPGSGYIRVALSTVITTNRTAWATTSMIALYPRIGACEFRMRGGLLTLSDAVTTGYLAYIGFFDSVSGEPSNGAYFRYTHSQNGGRWIAVMRNAGVETSTIDTGVAAAIGAESLFEIRVSADGNTFTYLINNVVVATITTGLVLNTTALGFGYCFRRTIGTAAANAAVFDYISFTQDLPNRT
jgi:hypothetical protein